MLVTNIFEIAEMSLHVFIYIYIYYIYIYIYVYIYIENRWIFLNCAERFSLDGLGFSPAREREHGRAYGSRGPARLQVGYCQYYMDSIA